MRTIISPGGDRTPYYEPGKVMSFRAPATILYGRGSALQGLVSLLPDARQRVFVLRDDNLTAAGVGDELISALQRDNSTIVEAYSRKPGEPRVSEVDDIAEAARAVSPTAIVAIGGGANLDIGKCIRVLAEHDGTTREYIEGRHVPLASVKLVAVATTAGTGSETGTAGLVVDEDTGEKLLFPGVRPEVAVVDPDLTLGVPPGPTTATGLDALAQAVGAYLCNFRHPITDVFAFEAIALLSNNIITVIRDGSNVEARAAMAYGSLLSGLALNNSGAIADQFFDEVIGPRYGIPHGVVAGIVLPYVVQYDRAAAQERVASLAETISDEPAATVDGRADQVVRRFADIAREADLPSLESAGVPRDDLHLLAEMVADHFGVEKGYDPRPITFDGALTMLEAAYDSKNPLEAVS